MLRERLVIDLTAKAEKEGGQRTERAEEEERAEEGNGWVNLKLPSPPVFNQQPRLAQPPLILEIGRRGTIPRWPRNMENPTDAVTIPPTTRKNEGRDHTV